MPVDIYGTKMSYPTRLALITAEVVGVKYDFHNIDLLTGEHKKPDFLKVKLIKTMIVTYNAGYKK